MEISIHAPSRERRLPFRSYWLIWNISIHAPSRERPAVACNIYSTSAISIHAPSRERPKPSWTMSTLMPISIHAPSRERPFSLPSKTANINLFQSTLPHGSDVKQNLANAVKQGISIHAPSRERLPCSHVETALSLFQSTLPHGSDLFHLKNLLQLPIISIHAPSRERLPCLRCFTAKLYFNPRSLTGATILDTIHGIDDKVFQSTLPHGSDRFPPCSTWSRFPFQSTLPHGSDSIRLPIYLLRTIISIHAPSRERRSFFGSIVKRSAYFNPRSLTGATEYSND